MTESSNEHRRKQASTSTEAKSPAKRSTKAATITRLLSRAKGATLVDLQKATGWQPHSVRAALSGLRKRGVPLTRTAANGRSVYRIGSEP